MATWAFCLSVALFVSNRMSGRLTTTPRAVWLICATAESAPVELALRSSRSWTQALVVGLQLLLLLLEGRRHRGDFRRRPLGFAAGRLRLGGERLGLAPGLVRLAASGIGGFGREAGRCGAFLGRGRVALRLLRLLLQERLLLLGRGGLLLRLGELLLRGGRLLSRGEGLLPGVQRLLLRGRLLLLEGLQLGGAPGCGRGGGLLGHLLLRRRGSRSEDSDEAAARVVQPCLVLLSL